MQPTSIRAFVGASNFQLSRAFYLEIGFQELAIDAKMSFFRMGYVGFYLQDYYVKDWVDNSMLFLEIESPEQFLEKLKALNLPEKYPRVKLSDMQMNDWGREFFLHDPSGVLWHIGCFKD